MSGTVSEGVMMRRKMFRRRGGMIALAALTASLAVSVPQPAQAATCTSLLVIGARGSGEPYDGNAGMGSMAFAAYQQIKSRVPDAQAYGLPYEAVAVTPDTITQVGAYYWPSIDTGIRFLTSRVNSAIADCPYQRIALIGYSQGAHVIADTLPQWGNNPAIRNKIAAVLLFGDPRFNPSSPIDRGTFDATKQGIWPSNGITSARTVSSTWFDITRSYCDLNDFICNYSLSAYFTCKPGSSCGHFGYVNNFTAQSAGTWAGNLIKSLPPLAPPPPPSSYTYRVVGTGGIGLNVRSAPSSSGAKIGWIPEGGTVTIDCQVHGQRVLAGSDIWDHLVAGGWVYDWYVSTPGVGVFSIRQC